MLEKKLLRYFKVLLRFNLFYVLNLCGLSASSSIFLTTKIYVKHSCKKAKLYKNTILKQRKLCILKKSIIFFSIKCTLSYHLQNKSKIDLKIDLKYTFHPEVGKFMLSKYIAFSFYRILYFHCYNKHT